MSMRFAQNAQRAVPPVPSGPAPLCDACKHWGWIRNFPGESSGVFVNSLGNDLSGKVCILHQRSSPKSPILQNEAIRLKLQDGDLNFDGAYITTSFGFHEEAVNASFQRAYFEAKVECQRISFSGSANFAHANFSGGVDFEDAIFSYSAMFHRAVFGKPTSFRNAVFREEADFSFTTFLGSTEFVNTTFSGDGIFRKAKFDGTIRFEKLNKEIDSNGAPLDRMPLMDFSYINLTAPELLNFNDVNMENVRTVGTNLIDVDFTNVRWPERLYDTRTAEPKEYPSVEKHCRLLRKL